MNVIISVFVVLSCIEILFYGNTYTGGFFLIVAAITALLADIFRRN